MIVPGLDGARGSRRYYILPGVNLLFPPDRNRLREKERGRETKGGRQAETSKLQTEMTL